VVKAKADRETGSVSVFVQDLRVVRDGVALAGSLWMPGHRPKSVLLMHPGSGPSDRNNDVLFPPIRAALLDAGHAVASFDKRGAGESTGSLWTTSIEQQAADLVECAAAVSIRLRGVPIGAFGHSQGGWVVYEAAGTTDTFDFVVANSGPGVSPADQERHALIQATDGHVDQAGALMLFDELVARARSRQPLSEVVGQIDVARAGSLRSFAAGLLESEGKWGLASLLMAYEPEAALAALDVPLLAVFGADDPIVPVEASVDALRRLVDDDLLNLAVLDGGGHRLEPRNGKGYVDKYLDTITCFVSAFSQRHSGRRRRPARRVRRTGG
jgi:pimeloyl-ACP methyl ester carboxylesterase